MYGEGADPRTGDLKSSTVIYGPGKIVTHDSTNNTFDLTAVGEIALGVSAGASSRDADGTLETSSATFSYYPLGGLLMVQATNGETWTTGLPVYITNSGLATISSGSSAKKLGLYVGNGQTTGALGANGAGDTTNTEGDMIPVMTAGAEIA